MTWPKWPLVQVTAEQAQILEEDATKAHELDDNRDLEEVVPKARDPNSSDCNPEEVATKARDLDIGDCDVEEDAMKARDPNFVYYRPCEHEGARVLTVVCLFITAIISTKTVTTDMMKIVVKSRMSDLVSIGTESVAYS